MRTRLRVLGASVLALSLVAAACGDDDDDGGAADTADTADTAGTAGTTGTEAPGTSAAPTGTGAGGECESVDSIKLQLQWVTQAQFAGYFAANDQGYFENRCLEVELIENPPDITPQQQLADGAVDFAIAWVPKALATREAGADIVNIAQIFQRSGTLQVSFKDAGITTPEDFAGKNIGNWGFGNEYEVFAALNEAGLDPTSDVNLVAQEFNMLGLLSGDIDAAEAMTYNEYAQVLEAENPDTGELYQPEDLNVISYEDVGVGMLQDAIWADGARLESDEAYRDAAVRFLAASFEGWAYCRDNPEACKDIVVAAGSQLGDSHQLWQMNEINKLIWPAENGIGYIDQAAWDRTVEIAQNTPNLEGTTVLTEPPSPDAFTNDLVEEAHALLGDSVDLNGAGFTEIEVTLNPGGS
jgi:NitT/TauT family transport system substrate-binding protein